MGKTTGRQNLFSLTVLVLAATGFAAAVMMQSMQDSKFEHAVEERASRIFAYDRVHARKLPPNKLYALSIAIRFGDYSGADRLIGELELRM